jgi:SepF-like predicted cell division protein (DUF552 family)
MMRVAGLLSIFKKKDDSAVTELIDLLKQIADALEIPPDSIYTSVMKKMYNGGKHVVLTHVMNISSDADELELTEKIIRGIVQRAKHFTNQLVAHHVIVTPKTIITNNDIAIYMTAFDDIDASAVERAAKAAGMNMRKPHESR